MQELEDSVLLRQYTEHGSEEAFASLVARHVNKVYSVAMRHTGNPHQADEITQAVFVILARKAVHLTKGVVLSGWLCQTARLTAVTFIRSEIRRTRREQEAQMQTSMNQTEGDLWPRIAPLLDTAMSGLSEADHHAVVLRFFDGKSMKEVGTALGTSEGAAKVRVNRAVGKLRLFFTRRDVVVSEAVLMAAIASNSVQAAPLALAKAATAVALAKGATASTSTLTLVNGVLKLMAWTKAKTAIMVGLAVILGAGTTTSIVTTQAVKSKNVSSSQNGTIAANRTTPLGTMLVMANAMEAGDAKTYVESFVFITSEELSLKPTLEALMDATDRFNRAMIAEFGAGAAHAVFPNMPFAIPTNMIRSLQQRIEGDSAAVFLTAKGGRPIQFTRLNGEWKMAADSFVHLSPAVMNDIYARAIKALDETTPEIPQKKFKTALEAVDRMKERAR